MNLCVIPARGGSKRIPRKNINPFAGKPMIAYAIDAAKASGLFEHIVVSTDDAEIARIALDSGAETPFLRPTTLADDHTATAPVVVHTITTCETLGWTADKVCCIYPCVPFIQISDLKTSLDMLEKTEAPYCFPVAKFPSATQRALKQDSDGRMYSLDRDYELLRSQDLEPTYYDAGQFYWGTSNAWLTINRIHTTGIGLVIPQWRVVDIDTPEDWRRAEILYQCFGKQKL